MGTVADRYARAITSSNLRMHDQRVGDVDVLIASGLTSRRLSKNTASLASMLYRLRIEYDKVDKRSLAHNSVNMTHVLLALTHVRSLVPTLEAMRSFVDGQAWREGMQMEVQVKHRVADRVLDFILDPTCHRCNGVRFKVVTGTSRLSGEECSSCLGSGKRPLFFDEEISAEEYELTGIVKDAVQRKMNKFNQRVGNLLRL